MDSERFFSRIDHNIRLVYENPSLELIPIAAC